MNSEVILNKEQELIEILELAKEGEQKLLEISEIATELAEKCQYCHESAVTHSPAVNSEQ